MIGDANNVKNQTWIRHSERQAYELKSRIKVVCADEGYTWEDDEFGLVGGHNDG